jgi:hypothetical protein
MNGFTQNLVNHTFSIVILLKYRFDEPVTAAQIVENLLRLVILVGFIFRNVDLRRHLRPGMGNYFRPRATLRLNMRLAGQILVKGSYLKNYSSRLPPVFGNESHM